MVYQLIIIGNKMYYVSANQEEKQICRGAGGKKEGKKY
jgi:hypothetical protein